MKTNELKPVNGAVKKRKRKGRGNASGLGGECGRGHKGQKSRAGYSKKPGFEGGQMPLYRRIPKKRGFHNPFKVSYVPINLSTLEKFFKEKDIIEINTFYERGLANAGDLIKILGTGTLSKKIKIKTHKISKAASKKIEEVGASFEIVS